MSYRLCRYILRQLWQQPFGHVLVSSFVQPAFWHFSAETESSAVHEPYLGRDGLASERRRSARRAGQDEQGRKGRAPHRLGPPPPAEEGPSRAGSTTARASHTRRSARPPRLSPRQARRSCPRTPRRTPSRLSAARPPARSRPSPSCGGFAPPL